MRLKHHFGKNHSVAVLSLFIFLAGLALTYRFALLHHRAAMGHERSAMAARLDKARGEISRQLDSVIYLSQGLVSLVKIKHGIEKDQFVSMTQEIVASEPRIRNIALAPKNIIRFVYPMKGNERALGLDYLKNPDQREAVLRAIREKATVVAGPVNLVQGGVGIVTRTPIFIRDSSASTGEQRYWGIASMVIDFDTFIKSVGLSDGVNRDIRFALRGKDGLGASGMIFWGDGRIFTMNPIFMDITFSSGSWQIAALPANGWPVFNPLRSLYFLFGCLLSFMFSILFFQLIRINSALRQEIRERVDIEKALRKSEEKYRSIFENSAEGICQSTPDGRFISVNPALAHIYGYESPEEMIAGVADIAKQLYVNPEERIQYKCLLEKHGAVKNYEHRSYRKDGAIIWVSLNTRVVKDPSGRILYFDTMVEDITNRKVAEESLKQEKETLFTILESDPCGIAVVSRNGVYKYVNPEFTKITGYTLADITTGKDWFQKAYPDLKYRKKVFKAWKKDVREEGKGADTEFTIMCKDGSQKDIEFRTTYLKDFTVTIMIDITGRKEMEAKLHIMSIVDDLTGLYNRRGFFTLAQQQFKLSERASKGMILFFADIDRMKWINDTLGHQEGDRVLIETASVLRQTFRESDIIGRMGGDEFAILAIDATDETRETLMYRLQNILDGRNGFETKKYTLSLSVGSTHYDHKNPVSLDELIAQADKLMYQEKRKKYN